jgi:hypothetical protein
LILGIALSAVGARAAEEAGPPCSATVKDHCIEGASSSAGKWHKHVARHHKRKMAMAKPAASAPAKAAVPAPAKPVAKPKGK